MKKLIISKPLKKLNVLNLKLYFCLVGALIKKIQNAILAKIFEIPIITLSTDISLECLKFISLYSYISLECFKFISFYSYIKKYMLQPLLQFGSKKDFGWQISYANRNLIYKFGTKKSLLTPFFTGSRK
jgi:hypothetical protein